jgi:hypothetical protein
MTVVNLRADNSERTEDSKHARGLKKNSADHSCYTKPMSTELPTADVPLFGIQFQVWHFLFLGIGAIALIYTKITGR